MHNILHEFEFWPNGTTDYGVSCPDGSQVSDLAFWATCLLCL